MADKTNRTVPVENFHGVLVADPFRWLEDPIASETKEFVRSQNARTREVLDALTARDGIRQRLETLWRLPQYFTPVKAAGRLFFLQNDGQKNQPALYVVDADKAGDTPKLLVDPNQMSDNGTVALTQFGVSRDGAKVAYATA